MEYNTDGLPFMNNKEYFKVEVDAPVNTPRVLTGPAHGAPLSHHTHRTSVHSHRPPPPGQWVPI